MEEDDHGGGRHHHQNVMDLLDFNWFAGNVLYGPDADFVHRSPPPPVPLTPQKPQPVNFDVSTLPLSLRAVRHNSLPESQVLRLQETQIPFSPDSVLQSRKLDTILSGKAGVADYEDGERVATRSAEPGSPARRLRSSRRARERRGSRSLSELEFEELKGFMDLGFTFPIDDVTPRLAMIVPGLQRLGISPDSGGGVDGDGEPEEGEEDDGKRRRPYLSEAWEFYGGQKCPSLQGWKLPDDADGVEMKEHLRTWAQRVAATVR